MHRDSVKRLIICVAILAIFAAGCAHVMSEANLAMVDRSLLYGDIGRNPDALAGRSVLVGGIISGARSSGDIMQLEVAQLELFDSGVPDEASASGGRFLVISGELLDPVFYQPGLLVSVIGEIKGQRIQKLNGVDYRYPVISAREIQLFRAMDLSSTRPVNPYQEQAGDKRFMLRQPGAVKAEPPKPF